MRPSCHQSLPPLRRGGLALRVGGEDIVSIDSTHSLLPLAPLTLLWAEDGGGRVIFVLVLLLLWWVLCWWCWVGHDVRGNRRGLCGD